jgi:hypothetical protein
MHSLLGRRRGGAEAAVGGCRPPVLGEEGQSCRRAASGEPPANLRRTSGEPPAFELPREHARGVPDPEQLAVVGGQRV